MPPVRGGPLDDAARQRAEEHLVVADEAARPFYRAYGDAIDWRSEARLALCLAARDWGQARVPDFRPWAYVRCRRRLIEVLREARSQKRTPPPRSPLPVEAIAVAPLRPALDDRDELDWLIGTGPIRDALEAALGRGEPQRRVAARRGIAFSKFVTRRDAALSAARARAGATTHDPRG